MGGKQIFICQPLNHNEDAPFEYQADNEQFSGSFELNQNVWRTVKQLGKFRTKTRMGIPFTVTASSEVEFNASLAVHAHKHGCIISDEFGISRKYLVPVPRGDAPSVKSSGYVVYIGKLEASRVFRRL